MIQDDPQPPYLFNAISMLTKTAINIFVFPPLKGASPKKSMAVARQPTIRLLYFSLMLHAFMADCTRIMKLVRGLL